MNFILDSRHLVASDIGMLAPRATMDEEDLQEDRSMDEDNIDEDRRVGKREDEGVVYDEVTA